MATQTAAERQTFVKSLGRLYGLYTGGFLAFIIALAVMEQAGVPNRVLGYFFVFFPLDLGRKYYESPCSHNVSL